MTTSISPAPPKTPPLRLFFAAGEASGDHYAAELFLRIKSQYPHCQAQGLGGAESRAAGIKTVVDLQTVSVMGLVEVLKHYGQLKRALTTLIEAMIAHNTDLLIAIDFQEFNQRLAKAARKRGIKVLFFVAPQVWAWRPKRAAKFAQVADHLAVLFDFEVPLFAKYGLPTTHVGHPLRDLIPAELCKTAATATLIQTQARQNLNVSHEGIVVGLLPGSRQSELTRLVPVLLATAQRLLDEHPTWRFVLPLASSIPPDWFDALLAESLPSPALKAALTLTSGQARQVMAAADALIIASGTATLEAALIGTPMVLIYKTHPLTYRIARYLVNVARIGLPNIVLGQDCVPELIQDDANPPAIQAELNHLIHDEMDNQRACLNAIAAHLGPLGALDQLAQLALHLAAPSQTTARN
ncbi:MAG: lipid-A-disaccharide synthase [Halothiobacillus sp. 20-53-49]|nr:MAG: lipid-A-disaccharide synthase [Halothiobacillus sp. 20-53-49]HUN00367.1 lipid-A-disaccharide synthase [Halothiobacillus sp.]